MRWELLGKELWHSVSSSSDHSFKFITFIVRVHWTRATGRALNTIGAVKFHISIYINIQVVFLLADLFRKGVGRPCSSGLNLYTFSFKLFTFIFTGNRINFGDTNKPSLHDTLMKKRKKTSISIQIRRIFYRHKFRASQVFFRQLDEWLSKHSLFHFG